MFPLQHQCETHTQWQLSLSQLSAYVVVALLSLPLSVPFYNCNPAIVICHYQFPSLFRTFRPFCWLFLHIQCKLWSKVQCMYHSNPSHHTHSYIGSPHTCEVETGSNILSRVLTVCQGLVFSYACLLIIWMDTQYCLRSSLTRVPVILPWTWKLILTMIKYQINS